MSVQNIRKLYLIKSNKAVIDESQIVKNRKSESIKQELETSPNDETRLEAISKNFEDAGCVQYLNSTIGGNRDSGYIKRTLKSCAKALTWTYHRHHNTQLDPSEALPWLREVITTEYAVLNFYSQHLELLVLPGTVKNHLHQFYHIAQWYALYSHEDKLPIGSLTGMDHVKKALCKALRKKDKKRHSRLKSMEKAVRDKRLPPGGLPQLIAAVETKREWALSMTSENVNKVIYKTWLGLLYTVLYVTMVQGRVSGIEDMKYKQGRELMERGYANSGSFKTAGVYKLQAVSLSEFGLALMIHYLKTIRPCVHPGPSLPDDALFLNWKGEAETNIGRLVTACCYWLCGLNTNTTYLRALVATTMHALHSEGAISKRQYNAVNDISTHSGAITEDYYVHADRAKDVASARSAFANITTSLQGSASTTSPSNRSLPCTNNSKNESGDALGDSDVEFVGVGGGSNYNGDYFDQVASDEKNNTEDEDEEENEDKQSHKNYDTSMGYFTTPNSVRSTHRSSSSTTTALHSGSGGVDLGGWNHSVAHSAAGGGGGGSSSSVDLTAAAGGWSYTGAGSSSSSTADNAVAAGGGAAAGAAHSGWNNSGAHPADGGWNNSSAHSAAGVWNNSAAHSAGGWNNSHSAAGAHSAAGGWNNSSAHSAAGVWNNSAAYSAGGWNNSHSAAGAHSAAGGWNNSIAHPAGGGWNNSIAHSAAGGWNSSGAHSVAAHGLPLPLPMPPSLPVASAQQVAYNQLLAQWPANDVLQVAQFGTKHPCYHIKDRSKKVEWTEEEVRYIGQFCDNLENNHPGVTNVVARCLEQIRSDPEAVAIFHSHHTEKSDRLRNGRRIWDKRKR